jgi:hypothetical protein
MVEPKSSGIKNKGQPVPAALLGLRVVPMGQAMGLPYRVT